MADDKTKKPPKYRPDDWADRMAVFMRAIEGPTVTAMAPTLSTEGKAEFLALWREARIPTYDEYQQAQRDKHLPDVADALKKWFLEEDE
jgi:hypothetical protein